MRFTSPPKQQEYYLRVWQLVRRIPLGRVVTYGQIAYMLAPPAGVESNSYRTFAPRWVGGAMAACPNDVPWQRVINSQGKISHRSGGQKQRELLEAEGVEFVKDKVDLKEFGWNDQNE